MKQAGFKTFLSFEPLADFDLGELLPWIKAIAPEAIEIGLENYTKFTDKPSEEKIVKMLKWLGGNGFTYILKENLRHLEDTTNE